MKCSGALGCAGTMTAELELCAALNRGVAMNTAGWYDPASYYPAATAKNDFAQLFHTIGLHGRAYGFARDDVNDQSTRQVLPNADPPTSLTISIGW